MRAVECPREQDLLDAIASGRWPARCDGDLRAHVERCESCADVLAVVPSIADEREIAFGEAAVPCAGTVWWRAQIRARQEAARHAARPIAVAHATATTLLLAALAAAAILLAPGLSNPLGFLNGALPNDLPRLDLPPLATSMDTWRVAAVVLGPGVLMAPLVIYLALTEE